MNSIDIWPFGHLPPERASAEAMVIAVTDLSAYAPDAVIARELKRYFLIRKTLERRVGMESRRVDEAWHRFILDTRNYFSFCGMVFGKYLHHTPSHVESDPRFAAVYHELFGEPLHPVWREKPGRQHSYQPPNFEWGGCL